MKKNTATLIQLTVVSILTTITLFLLAMYGYNTFG